MEKLKLHTPDFTDENIARLAELFPNCVTEVKEEGVLKRSIDFDQLKQELSGSIVDGPRERYRLDWPGKREAILTANAPIAKTLRPCREESVDFEKTQNLFIEGDNLDALKLLQETYLGKVKMIYIDPPYNTGKEFIYNDDFKESTEDYFERSNQQDEEGNRMVANSESNGRFHSDWLSMMYPRLKLARNLLREDGVIFISIDDAESSNLKSLMNEVFGEDNFIDTIAIEMSTTSGPKTVNAQQGTIVKNVEFVHIYKRSDKFEDSPRTPLLDGVDSYDTHYSIWLNEDGTLDSLSDKLMGDTLVGRELNQYGFLKNGKFSVKNMDKLLLVSAAARKFVDANLERIARVDRPPVSAAKISTEVGMWTSFNSEHRVYLLTTLSNGNLQALMPLSLNYRMSDDYKPRFGRTVIRGDLWKGFHQDMGNVTKEGDIPFANGKKPTRLIRQLAKWAIKMNDDIILDFFSGSATTAHAVMQLNAEDGGSRRHIMVQLPEACDEKSEAAKAGYETIAEIGKERIRRAGAKIKEENAEKEGIENLDVGFRVLKVADSNMLPIYYEPESLGQGDLLAQVENIKPDRTGEDLLFQVLLDWGVDLALPIERYEGTGGKTLYQVDRNALIACFEPELSEELLTEIAKKQPLRAVFRDLSFTTDATRINAEQIFKHHSPGTDLRVI